ncbi:hypothetical protein DTO164E3_905 [Paecilomyces variotii]|nr:hypothetical protein DTO032I3_7051 [Paecilomyces variotii]KAJ9206664.1 hypothetical protein DTO164E3_905 [Paecilomyces variotii]KAJ9221081.1 hypothetical protein DTO169C6_6602 [Paecilomyces variotii]KAJ9262588.1 hypothetical protein DTO212C5_7903 [Paecilomyces variotii]KAJ9276653.1 hypothetical protein DTO021D3_6564 [Paecilomyces variotii]
MHSCMLWCLLTSSSLLQDNFKSSSSSILFSLVSIISPLALAEALTILVRTRSVLHPLPLVALATAVTCLAV